jgi:hypothetical protein
MEPEAVVSAVLPLVDATGVAAFAATGALAAGRKGMDITGFALLAIVTGVGGDRPCGHARRGRRCRGRGRRPARLPVARGGDPARLVAAQPGRVRNTYLFGLVS